MTETIRILGDDPDVAFVKFARSRRDRLARLMKFQNLRSSQRKTIFPDGSYIHVRRSFGRDLIDIYIPFGGAAEDLYTMLFCKPAAGGVEVFAYHHETNRLTSLGTLPVGSSSPTLHSFHDSRTHLNTGTTYVGVNYGYNKTADYQDTLTTEDGGTGFIKAFRTDETTGREYAVIFKGGRPILYARVPGEKFKKVAEFPSRANPGGFEGEEAGPWKWAIEDGDDPRAFQISGGYVYLGGWWQGEAWNLFEGYEFFGIKPNSSDTHIIQWFSELWFWDPLDSGMAPGMNWKGIYGPYKEASVEFGCLLDDRAGSDGPGLCEMLVEAEYIDDERAPTENYEGMMVIKNKYTDGVYQPYFTFDSSDYLTPSDSHTYHYWSCVGDAKAERPSTGIWCLLIFTAGGRWCLLDHPGYQRQVLNGSYYHTHTVSNDGNLVMIVEGADNRRGVLLDVTTGEVTYHDKISDFTSGCFIPPVSESREEITGYADIGDTETTMADPSMGAVRPGISQSSTLTNTHWKIVSDEPYIARGALWWDPCWKWTATEVAALSGGALIRVAGDVYPISEAPFLIGGTYDNTLLFGQWDYSSSTEFTTKAIDIEPVSESVVVSLYDHPDVYLLPYGILGYPPNTLYLQGSYSPPVGWSSTGESELETPFTDGEDPDGFFATLTMHCPGDYIVSAEDACGRSGTATVTNEDYYMFIQGEDLVAEGNSYVAYGGYGPYTYSFDKGSINADGEITSLSGDCGDPGGPAYGTVTAVDQCGTRVDFDVRLPGGSWVVTNYECGPGYEPEVYGPCNTPWPGCFGAVTAQCTYFSGITNKYVEYWRESGGCSQDWCAQADPADLLGRQTSYPCDVPPIASNYFCHFQTIYYEWQCP